MTDTNTTADSFINRLPSSRRLPQLQPILKNEFTWLGHRPKNVFLRDVNVKRKCNECVYCCLPTTYGLWWLAKPTYIRSHCRLGNGNQLCICMRFLETCSFTLFFPFYCYLGSTYENLWECKVDNWDPLWPFSCSSDNPTKRMSSSLNSKLLMVAPEAPGAGRSLRVCLDGQTHPHTV